MKIEYFGMLFFLGYSLASLNCYGGFDTAVVTVSLHVDPGVIEDIKDYMESTTGHIFSDTEAAQYFFGDVFDNTNKILDRFGVQLLADYRNLMVEAEGCYEGITLDKGSEFLSKIETIDGLKGMHVLLLKCTMAENAVMISGKCGRLIVLTHTFITDLEKNLSEQILRTLGTSPRLRIESPVFDTKFSTNICAYLDACVSLDESNGNKLLEGSLRISNRPTARSKIQDIHEYILEDFDNSLNQIIKLSKSPPQKSSIHESPLKRLEYLDIEYLPDGKGFQNDVMKSKMHKPKESEMILPENPLVSYSPIKNEYLNTHKIFRSKNFNSIRRSRFLGSNRKRRRSPKRRSRPAESEDRSLSLQQHDKNIPPVTENPTQLKNIDMTKTMDIILTSPLFSKGKPKRPLMPEDIMIPNLLSNMDRNHGEKKEVKDESRPVRNLSDPTGPQLIVGSDGLCNIGKTPTEPFSPEVQMASDILSKLGKIPTDQPMKTTLSKLNKPSDFKNEKGMLLIKKNPLQELEDEIKKINDIHRRKIEPFDSINNDNIDELHFSSDSPDAFIAKDDQNLPAGHYPGDSDEILERITSNRVYTPATRISIRHNFQSLAGQKSTKSIGLTDNIEYGQSFNTPEERAIFIKTRSSPDFNPNIRKAERGLLLSDYDERNARSLNNSLQKKTWSRSSRNRYKSSSSTLSRLKGYQSKSGKSLSSSQKSLLSSRRSGTKYNSSSLTHKGKNSLSKHGSSSEGISGGLNAALGSGEFSGGDLGLSASIKSKFSGNINTAVTDLQNAKNSVDNSIKDLRKTAMGKDPQAFSESIKTLADSNEAMKKTLSDIERKADSTSNTDLLKKDIKGIIGKETDYESLTADIRKRIEKKDVLDKLKDNLGDLQSKSDEIQKDTEGLANTANDMDIKPDLYALQEKNQKIDEKITGLIEDEPQKEQAKEELGELASQGQQIQTSADNIKKSLDGQENKAINESMPKIKESSAQMQDIINNIDPKASSTANGATSSMSKPSDDQIRKHVNEALKNNVDVPGFKDDIKKAIQDDIEKNNKKNDRQKSSSDDDDGKNSKDEENGENKTNNKKDAPNDKDGNNSDQNKDKDGNDDSKNGDIAEKLKKFLDKANNEITSFKNTI